MSVKRRNRPVPNLTATDFELRDNGRLQTIEVERMASLPLDVDLVVDWSTLGRMYERLRTAPRNVADLLRAGDTLRTVVFDTQIHEWPEVMIGPDSDSERALPELEPADRVGGRTYSRWDRDLHPALEFPAMSDAIMLALSRRSAFGRRHVVLVLAWGHDDGSVVYLRVPLAPIAARSDAVLHAARFDARGIAYMTGGADPTGLLQRWLRRDTEEAVSATGGRIWNIRDGARVFADVFDDFRESYILRYTATGVDPGGWHEVTVRVPAHPEYEIRARKGYLGR